MNEDLKALRNIVKHLKRLAMEYKVSNKRELEAILCHGKVYGGFIESSHYEMPSTFMVWIFLPEEFMGKYIPANKQRIIEEKILSDLKNVVNYEIENLRFDVSDESDEKSKSAILINSEYKLLNNNLDNWKPGLRVFISHLNADKSIAHEFSIQLQKWGISSFVAHNDLIPFKRWLDELLKRLSTTQVVVALITSDKFNNNFWTNQEIGFAYARNIEILPVKFSTADPTGFIASIQAWSDKNNDAKTIAEKIFKHFAVQAKYNDYLRAGLIYQFNNPNSSEDAIEIFNNLENFLTNLSEDEEEKILKSINENKYLSFSNCASAYSKFTLYLSQATGKEFMIHNEKIIAMSIPDETQDSSDPDDIPF